MRCSALPQRCGRHALPEKAAMPRPISAAVGIVPRTDGDFVHEPIFTTKSRETAAVGVGGDPSGRVPPALQPNRLGRGHPAAHPHHPDRHRSDPPLPESEPGLRPIYHRKPVRAEGHLSVTVIAHRLVQVIRTRLRAAGPGGGWAALHRILEGRQRITATFRRDDERTPHVRKATRPEAPERPPRRPGRDLQDRRSDQPKAHRCSAT